MTKRFTLIGDTNGGLDTVLETMVKDNGKFLTHKECCDLLNNLTEENEVCKQAYQEVKSDAIRLKNENEQLKHFKEISDDIIKEVEDFFEKHEFDTVNFDALDEVFDDVDCYYKKCIRLKKENEQLKTELTELKASKEDNYNITDGLW